MAIARRDHTATLLKNGKVLIASWDTRVAELYDPTTGNFSPTGSTLFTRGSGATGTRLLDGRVLFVGGTGATGSAEIYDPVSETFNQTALLNVPRDFHSATLLAGGKVLIAGGDGPGFLTTATAEIYDPLTETFSLTSSLNTDRAGAVAALLNNGKVLIAEEVRAPVPVTAYASNQQRFLTPRLKLSAIPET